MANVALLGASGNAGTRILKELVERGHVVTAIARYPERIEASSLVRPVHGDANDPEALAKLFKGQDAVLSAVPFTGSDPALLVAAIRESGVARYIVVGGAGGLEVAPGELVIDQPEFPAEYKTEAAAGIAFLNYLKGVHDLQWTFLSPSAEFVPGERTGKFRLDKDSLIASAEGSSISFEDFAVAFVDELEQPAHINQRFTVGY